MGKKLSSYQKLKQKYEHETKILDQDIRILLDGTDIEKITLIHFKYKVADDIERMIMSGEATEEASFSGFANLIK